MNYWWVNQNQTYKYEVAGGFLWSPKAKKNGARNPFYENMRLAKPGDIMFSFCDTLIKAVSIVQKEAITANKSEFGSADMDWSEEGWLVEVEFRLLNKPIQIATPFQLRPSIHLPYC